MPYGYTNSEYPEFKSMLNVKIDHGVPIPEMHNTWQLDRPSKCKYPFHNMAVGDSFMLRCEKTDHIEIFRSRVLMCARECKSIGMQFTTRVIGYNTIRVWRIK